MTGPVLILGGRSDIGLAIAQRFAASGHAIQLAMRDPDKLDRVKQDIEVRHRVPVSVHRLDILSTERHAAVLDELIPFPEIVVCAVGTLPDQRETESDLALAALTMRTNYEAPALMLSLVANRMESKGAGVIVGISSVAGDRGRASNYTYGAAKAGFTAFLSGLRNRLANRGVHVLTVKPGFVATRMTHGMDLPPLLTASPKEVASAVETAVRKKRNVVYVRPIWRLIMTVICTIPEALFKRLNL